MILLFLNFGPTTQQTALIFPTLLKPHDPVQKIHDTREENRFSVTRSRLMRLVDFGSIIDGSPERAGPKTPLFSPPKKPSRKLHRTNLQTLLHRHFTTLNSHRGTNTVCSQVGPPTWNSTIMRMRRLHQERKGQERVHKGWNEISCSLHAVVVLSERGREGMISSAKSGNGVLRF